jgi:hypothetical protein
VPLAARTKCDVPVDARLGHSGHATETGRLGDADAHSRLMPAPPAYCIELHRLLGALGVLVLDADIRQGLPWDE